MNILHLAISEIDRKFLYSLNMKYQSNFLKVRNLALINLRLTQIPHPFMTGDNRVKDM